MFNNKLDLNDARLSERYFELNGVSDWRTLPREERMQLAFNKRDFWEARVKELKSRDRALDTPTVEDLLSEFRPKVIPDLQGDTVH